MASNSKDIKLIVGYSEAVDLKQLAYSLRDKKKTDKILDREFKLNSLEKDFFQIKRQPYSLDVDPTTEKYVPSNCKSCFEDDEDFHDPSCTSNIYIDLLNTKQLYALDKSSRFITSFMKKLFGGCKSSTDVKNMVLKNEYLLSFAKEVELADGYNPENNGSRKYSSKSIFNWIKAEAERTQYQFSRLCGSAVILLRNLACYFVERILISSIELQGLDQAEKQNLPIVYILRNQSRFDWFVVLCTQIFCNVKSPVVMLHGSKTAVFSWVYEKMGAICIRPRRFGTQQMSVKHVIYDETWLVQFEEHLKACNNLMFYLNNSHGNYDDDLMFSIMDAVRREEVKDVLIVPVIVNYEKKHHFDGCRNIFSLTTLRKCLQLQFGFVKVNFLKTLSTKALMSALYGRKNVCDMNVEEISELTQKMMLHLDYDMYRGAPITSVSLVSYLLLKKFRHGVEFDVLEKQVKHMKIFLMYSKIRLGFTGKSSAIIEHAISTLGSKLVIIKETGKDRFISPVLDLPFVLELHNYAFETVSHFIIKSVIFTIIAVFFREEYKNGFRTRNELKFSLDDLLEKATGLCNILIFEYPFTKPCKNLETELNEEFLKCCDDGFFTKIEKFTIEEERIASRVASMFDDFDFTDEDEDDEDHLPRRKKNDDQYLINLSNEKSFLEEVDLHKNNLQVYIDAYIISADHLMTLINKQLPKVYYVKTLMDKMISKLKDKQIQYPESVSTDILNHTIDYFVHRKILSLYLVKHTELVSLCFEYNNSSSVSSIVKEIEEYQF